MHVFISISASDIQCIVSLLNGPIGIIIEGSMFLDQAAQVKTPT